MTLQVSTWLDRACRRLQLCVFDASLRPGRRHGRRRCDRYVGRGRHRHHAGDGHAGDGHAGDGHADHDRRGRGVLLADVPAGDVTIVAAPRGFYNEARDSSAPATDLEIRLQVVPADDDPAHVFARPESCAGCHPTQYAEWRDSAMSHGGTNTWVHDIHDGSGTPDGMGGFVYTRDSVHADDNPRL
jgi:hypothetical protein